MFRDARVGEKVWHIVYGWGEIKRLCHPNTIEVYFETRGVRIRFRLDGKEREEDLNPTLFWSEITFQTPTRFNLEERYRKLKRKTFEEGKVNLELECCMGDWEVATFSKTGTLGAIYFYSDQEKELKELATEMNKRKVRFEELNAIVKKIERE